MVGAGRNAPKRGERLMDKRFRHPNGLVGRGPGAKPVVDGTLCAKCHKPICKDDGRRYRMKYRHYHCLPPTRLSMIKCGSEYASITRKKYEGGETNGSGPSSGKE